MSQPTVYNRQFSFTNDQASNPSTKTPGDELDVEFNAIKTTLDQIRANLALIQRDDGDLANDSVGSDQLGDTVGLVGDGASSIVDPYVVLAAGSGATTFYATKYGVSSTNTAAANKIALQAVIDVAIASPFPPAHIILPSGNIPIVGPININTANSTIAMTGAGPRQTQFVVASDSGNLFVLTTVPECLFSNFGIVATVELTSGAFFDLNNVFFGSFENLYLQDPFVGIKCRGCTAAFHNVNVIGAQYFSDVSYKTGSYLLWAASSSVANATLKFSNCNFGPSGADPSTQSKYQYAIFLQSVDGFQANNCHVAGAKQAHVAIIPAAGKFVGGVRLTDVWLDYYCTNNLYLSTPSTDLVLDISCVNCTFQGAVAEGIYVSGAHLDGFTLVGCTIENEGAAGLNMVAGTGFVVSGNVFKHNNSAAGDSNIVVGAGVTGCFVGGNHFASGAGTTYHINIATGAVATIGPNFPATASTINVTTPSSNILIFPSTTENVGFGTSAGSQRVVVQGANNAFATKFIGGATAGQSFGALIDAGTNASDNALLIRDVATNDMVSVLGTGNVKIVRSGLTVGVAPTGGDKGVGTVNVAADIYKNNTAYTNPDFVFEHFYNGKIALFADSPGAADYCGLMPYQDLREFTKTNLRLPGITDAPAGVFDRADHALRHIEDNTLRILDLNDRLSALEKFVV